MNPCFITTIPRFQSKHPKTNHRRNILCSNNNDFNPNQSSTSSSSLSSSQPNCNQSPLNISRRKLITTTAAIALSSLLPQQELELQQQFGKAAKAASPTEMDSVFDTQSGSFVPPSCLDEIFRRDAGSIFDRCIVASEIHSNKHTHDAQLAIIDSARRLEDGRKLIIGFEQFYRSHDKYLNDYVNKQLPLSDLLDVTDWNNTWGFDYKLYEPIFEYCQNYNIAMHGLNVPSTLTSAIARIGVEGLPIEVQNLLPDMDMDNKIHFKLFESMINSSGHFSNNNGDGDETLKRYYQVQVLWEEWMSQSAANSLKLNPGARLVTLIGSGHVEARVGFPDRLEKRLNERPYTIVPRPVSWTNDDGYFTPDISEPATGVADLVWYTRL